ncbi:MAG: CinA family protein [Selenomonadaceae bacterium]|nr:CinA family protein [Selenomonadaceae bacterium]
MNLEIELGKLLTAKNLTIACAESCTGGLLTSRLTDVSGSSAYVQGSIVSYSNEIKNSVLKVQAETLKNFGAVSEQTARQMSANVRELFKTDIGVGVTGIAGPSGGTAEKPVGTVYISVSDSRQIIVKLFNFSGSRSEIKNQACEAAMQMVIDVVNSI